MENDALKELLLKMGKRARQYLTILAILLISVLPACSAAPDASVFNGSRTGNDSQFLMNYTALNMTDSQALDVKAGDTIHVEIVVTGGCLSYEIQKEDEAPIAVGSGISASEEFDVKAEASGIYTVTVTGARAKGSVKFVVMRTDEAYRPDTSSCPERNAGVQNAPRSIEKGRTADPSSGLPSVLISFQFQSIK